MINKKSVTFILMMIVITFISCGKENKKAVVTDYLNAGSVTFDNVKYNLAWSSHPADNYYKQEYIADGDSIQRFKKLILLEVLNGQTQLKDVVDSKVAELKKMKESDPLVNYELFEKDGEIMIDFLISGKVPDGNVNDIIERNVYRYKLFKDKNGKEGILLFGICERAYGEDIDNFLISLKGKRLELLNTAGAFNIPEVTITR